MNSTLPQRPKHAPNTNPAPPSDLQLLSANDSAGSAKPQSSQHYRHLTSPLPSTSTFTSFDQLASNPSSITFAEQLSPRPYANPYGAQSQSYLSSPRQPYQFSDRVSPGSNLYTNASTTQLARIQDKLEHPALGNHPYFGTATAQPHDNRRRLRKSTSFLLGTSSTMNNQNLRQIDRPLVSPRNRLSDESGDSLKPGRKKSGISTFVKGVFGSPAGSGSSKKPEISSPENPVHLTHVGVDNQTGQYTVCACFFEPLSTTFPILGFLGCIWTTRRRLNQFFEYHS